MENIKRTSPAKVKAHFKKTDSKVYAIIKDVDFKEWYKEPKTDRDYFTHLCYEIIAQQLSGKAAGTITGRFKKLFPRGYVTAEKLLKTPDIKLREVGMSWSKVSFLKDLADKTFNKEIRYNKFHGMSDEDVMEELMQVKGIGPWTAEMFLMFALGREDVFSHADLGLRNGMKKVYGLKNVPDAMKADNITESWKPYRSYGCFALWHSIDNSLE